MLEAGWRALLVAGAHDALESLKPVVGADRADAIARHAACDPAWEARSEAVRWAGATGRCDDVVVRGLSDPDRKVALEAESIVRERVAHAGADEASERRARELVGRAADEFELHQSREVAAGMVAMRRAGWRDERWDRLSSEEWGRLAITRAVRSGSHDVIRVRAWELLGVPWLSTAAMDRLRQRCGVEGHAEVLERGHLGRSLRRLAAHRGRPEREQAAMIESLVPMNASVLDRVGEAACVGLGRLLGSMEADVVVRERWGRAALAHPSSLVRFAAWRATPRRTAIDYAFDRDERIAASAALAAGGEPGPWKALARSEHSRVRRIASEELARLGMLWAERSDAIVGLKRRATREPVAMEREWAGRWDAAGAAERVTLLKLARRVGLGAGVAEIGRRAIDPAAEPGSDAARVAATALVCFGDEPARRACLHAVDPRVRANAVETAASGTLLMELKADPHHRVRANAVRRLVTSGRLTGSAVCEHLEAMIRDDSVPHRLAGAWLASRVAAFVEPCEGAAMVAKRLDVESDLGVRARLADARRSLNQAVDFGRTREVA